MTVEEKFIPHALGEQTELKEVKVLSPVLPVLWFGEKTKPYVRGYGRLVMVNGKPTIQRVLWSDVPVAELKFPLTCIVCGGVSPQVRQVEGYAKVLASAHLPVIESHIVKAIGMGYKTYALLCSPVIPSFSDVLQGSELEVYDPPYVWWVDTEKRMVKCISSPR